MRVLKLLKRWSHKATTQVESNISLKKSHLPLNSTPVVKKEKRKQKYNQETKTKQKLVDIKQNLSLTSKVKSVCVKNYARSFNYN